jgi:hypothetical protein
MRKGDFSADPQSHLTLYPVGSQTPVCLPISCFDLLSQDNYFTKIPRLISKIGLTGISFAGFAVNQKTVGKSHNYEAAGKAVSRQSYAGAVVTGFRTANALSDFFHPKMRSYS